MTAPVCRPYRATVLDADLVTPRTRRILLGGDGLFGFMVPPDAWAPYLKLLLPRPDGSVARRTYSVRGFDAARCELAIDVLLHEPRGLASAWAAGVRPGDMVEILGPGWLATPPGVGWALFAGDASALPAIAYTLGILPRDAEGQALIALDDPADRQEIEPPPGIALRWIVGDLAEAVAVAPWRRGDTVVWAGAEAGAARAIRAFARKEKNLEPDHRPILNYWKRGAAEGAFGYAE